MEAIGDMPSQISEQMPPGFGFLSFIVFRILPKTAQQHGNMEFPVSEPNADQLGGCTISIDLRWSMKLAHFGCLILFVNGLGIE